jgi:hypothetical protein
VAVVVVMVEALRGLIMARRYLLGVDGASEWGCMNMISSSRKRWLASARSVESTLFTTAPRRR